MGTKPTPIPWIRTAKLAVLATAGVRTELDHPHQSVE